MAYIIAICVDHEENVVADLTNRLHSDFTVLATIILSLQCGTYEDPSGIFEAETAFFERALTLGFIPLEEHCTMYAISVVQSIWTDQVRANVRLQSATTVSLALIDWRAIGVNK